MISTTDKDTIRLTELEDLLQLIKTTAIGDLLTAAIVIFEDLKDPDAIYVAEEAMHIFRKFINASQPNERLFSKPPFLPRDIADTEFIQLVRVDMAVHELCYCCEMVQASAEETSGGSTPTRFYLNGIYNYISSLFLIDRSKPTHKNLPMGGTVIRALFPLGLDHLLIPIKTILDEPFGEISFGKTILTLRHGDLVHGDFTITRSENLIKQTQFRSPLQQEKFAHLVWRFLHRLFLLHLNLLALISASGKDFGEVASNYLNFNGLLEKK